MTAAMVDRAVQSVVDACYSAGTDFGAFRTRLLLRLGRAVPFDVAFMAAVDPDTLLFTNAFADDALAASSVLFLDNEFGALRDVNRFVDLAHASDPVASLDQATKGDWAESRRWRDIMAPLGMGDELRVALRVDGTVWGFLCLHRGGVIGFDTNEMTVLRKLAPHVGEAIRRITALTSRPLSDASEAVILVADHVVIAVGGAVEDLEFGQLGVGGPLPVPLDAVVRRLEANEAFATAPDQLPAAFRMTTESGALIAVHAARLRDATGTGPIVLTVAPAAADQRASLLLAANGLTPAQRRVTRLVLQGRTTGQIVVDLHISANTVQDHLKAVFDKIGVRSRRDLVTALMNPPH